VTGALKTQQVKSAVPGFRTHFCLNPKPVPDELNHHAVSREGGPRHLHSALREPAGAMRTVDGGHNRIDGMQVGAVAVVSLPLHDPAGVWFRAVATCFPGEGWSCLQGSSSPMSNPGPMKRGAMT